MILSFSPRFMKHQPAYSVCLDLRSHCFNSSCSCAMTGVPAAAECCPNICAPTASLQRARALFTHSTSDCEYTGSDVRSFSLAVASRLDCPMGAPPIPTLIPDGSESTPTNVDTYILTISAKCCIATPSPLEIGTDRAIAQHFRVQGATAPPPMLSYRETHCETHVFQTLSGVQPAPIDAVIKGTDRSP